MHTKFTVFAVLLLVLAGITLVPTLNFPSSEDVSTFIGPRLWPLSLLLLLIVLSATLLVSTRLAQKKEAQQGLSRESDPESATDVPNATADDPLVAPTELNTPAASSTSGVIAAHRHWWVMGATVAYTLLMPVTGFLLATVMFTLACTLLLGARHWAALLATVVIAAVLIQGVFSTLLGIPLP
ncbi:MULTISPECIES: tripartite tricarboxylate transporter TctB family protein [Halomonas]|uniref:tripartite tricarboxylate transporter TctB family protein n=1 Tax=Halomonas TaxID=2745 RepID=UPI001A8D2A70|nr:MULTISPECIES: tripartite tricarboxylate transporter TctB family protein [Halomonas]MBN8413602.1 tripartite tricarboxylate transporter TctB family protein [Halomonas litopenaei]MBY5931233.1 tripartite tricarboxylate transporter TctB family protein [Halomonas sp. DP8Y7-3]